MSAAKIIVIGAGAAGIACATKLLKYGFQNLKILEAESRIGGRIHTLPFADNVVDMGAQWCHGEVDNIVFETAQKHELLAHTLESEKYPTYIRSNGEVVDPHLQTRLIKLMEDVLMESYSIETSYEDNLKNCLIGKFYAFLNLSQYQDIARILAAEFLENFLKERCTGTGSDELTQVSAKLQAKFRRCAGDELLTWKDKGFKTYLELLLKKQATGKEFGALHEHLKLTEKVKEIQWQRADGKVLIKTAAGEALLADHVVVTISLGVLKENHESLFVPALPAAKVKAIQNIGFGTVNKMLFEFDHPFWPSDWNGVYFLWRHADIEELKAMQRLWLTDFHGFCRVACQPRVLICWTVGPHRAEIEKLTNEEAKEAAMYLLRRFLLKSSFVLTEPIGFARSSWFSAPNFRGTWSYQSVETAANDVKNADLAAPLFENVESGGKRKPLVLFAGEATHEHYFATVHGATESGFREAKRLRDFYANKTYYIKSIH